MIRGAIEIASKICGIALILPLAGASRPAQQQPPAAHFAYGGNAAQVPAEMIDNLVFLPVRVNNSQPALFQLDSSAARSSIDPARAAEIGLAELRPAMLNLSGLDVTLGALATAAKKEGSAQVGRPFEGTLGGDFFSDLVVEIDYARQTVRFYDPGTYNYSGHGKSIPLTVAGGLPQIPAKFSVTGERPHEGKFIVDTALEAPVVISDRFAGSHHVFSTRAKTLPAWDPAAGGEQSAVVGRLKGFHLGPYAAEGALAVFSADLIGTGDAPAAGVIGAGMLRRFIVTFDFPHHQLILEPNVHFGETDQEDKSGLGIVAKGPGLKTFEIVQVLSGSPGAEAGIQKGDVIAGIDEDAAADLSLSAVRNLFRQVGHKYKLQLERDGKTLELTLQMRRLI
ncbi:MAG TPA: PDZ domain-containing protein [Candidatus Sulfotelmatobacter sp.]|nr:PDZ domain-containing protein [Candidatus Sulfotelmatobacter sp.]